MIRRLALVLNTLSSLMAAASMCQVSLSNPDAAGLLCGRSRAIRFVATLT